MTAINTFVHIILIISLDTYSYFYKKWSSVVHSILQHDLFLMIYFWLNWVFIVAHGLSLVVVYRLLIAVDSLVLEHRF